MTNLLIFLFSWSLGQILVTLFTNGNWGTTVWALSGQIAAVVLYHWLWVKDKD